MAQDHQDRPVRVNPLGHPEVVDAVVGDDVRQVVLWNKRLLPTRHSAVNDSRADAKAYVAMLGQCRILTNPLFYFLKLMRLVRSIDLYCILLVFGPAGGQKSMHHVHIWLNY